MDELLQKLKNTHDLTDYEALVVVGIIGMIAYSDNSLETAYDSVDEKLKSIVKRTLAMA